MSVQMVLKNTHLKATINRKAFTKIKSYDVNKDCLTNSTELNKIILYCIIFCTVSRFVH